MWPVWLCFIINRTKKVLETNLLSYLKCFCLSHMNCLWKHSLNTFFFLTPEWKYTAPVESIVSLFCPLWATVGPGGQEWRKYVIMEGVCVLRESDRWLARYKCTMQSFLFFCFSTLECTPIRRPKHGFPFGPFVKILKCISSEQVFV